LLLLQLPSTVLMDCTVSVRPDMLEAAPLCAPIPEVLLDDVDAPPAELVAPPAVAPPLEVLPPAPPAPLVFPPEVAPPAVAPPPAVLVPEVAPPAVLPPAVAPPAVFPPAVAPPAELPPPAELLLDESLGLIPDIVVEPDVRLPLAPAFATVICTRLFTLPARSTLDPLGVTV